MSGFSRVDHGLFYNITSSLTSLTLKFTRVDVDHSGGTLSNRTESYAYYNKALHHAWQSFLGGTHLDRIAILFPEVTSDITRYHNELWLREAMLERGFSPFLRELWLDGAVFEAPELEEFMLRHYDTLQEVVLVNTICGYSLHGLASMIKVMRNRLNLKRCEIIMHNRWHFDHDHDDMPADLLDILALYAADDGPIPDLYQVDLGLYVMGKETRGCTLPISPYESDEESNHGYMNEDSDLEVEEADEDEEEDQDQEYTDIGDNEVNAIE